jgi:hypothetical protein
LDISQPLSNFIWSESERSIQFLILMLKKDIIPRNYDRDFLVYSENTDIYNNKVIKEELYEGSQKRFIYWTKKMQK